MNGLMIIPSKNFFVQYWSNFGSWEINDHNKAIRDCSEILFELNRIRDSTNIQIKIPLELRELLRKHLECVAFSEIFHDSIAEIDFTTSKFDVKVTDVDEAVSETAKVYNDTHQIIIISDEPSMKAKISGDTTLKNVGVFSIEEFTKAFSEILNKE